MDTSPIDRVVTVPDGRRLLARELRRRLGPPPDPAPHDTVSIVVVNRDGASQLRCLVEGLAERTDYPHIELVLVDNGSTDESLAYVRSVDVPFPISIVANAHNESFSDANNQGAAVATGALLLFLNNDVEPFEAGWLRELVACLRASGAGAVGATLVHPSEEADRPHGLAVQHRGLGFREEDGLVQPVLHDWGASPLDEGLGRDVDAPVVVAACLLVEAERYRSVGGFTHGYVYGSEDIDFSLKIRASGKAVVCSGRSVLVHRPGSTRRKLEFERARDRKLRNHRLLLERWGPRLRREHDLGRLAGDRLWAAPGRGQHSGPATLAEAMTASFCVKVHDESRDVIERVEALSSELARRGRRFIVLRGTAVDDLRGLGCDIAIHVRGGERYAPKPGQFNVLWVVDARFDAPAGERARYDLVLAGGDPPESVVDATVAAAERQAFPMRIEDGRAAPAGRAPTRRPGPPRAPGRRGS